MRLSHCGKILMFVSVAAASAGLHASPIVLGQREPTTPKPGDLRAWIDLRRTGQKPDGWKASYGERPWGMTNKLYFERLGGVSRMQINGQMADPEFSEQFMNPDGTLKREAPAGFEYSPNPDWNEAVALPEDEHFMPMHFNNPGLLVRMGTGLISEPMAMDYDGDGVRDILLGCQSRRTKSTLFFRNLGSAGDVSPVFDKGVWIDSAGSGAIVTRALDGKEVVTTFRGVHIDDFPRTGFRGVKSFGLSPFGQDVLRGVDGWQLCDYNGDGIQDCMVTSEIYRRAWGDAYDSSGVWTGGVNSAEAWIYPDINAKPHKKAFPVPGPDGKPLLVGRKCMIEDFDGDGDLDIIGSSVNGNIASFVYCQNVGSREKPRYAAMRGLVDEEGHELTMDCPLVSPSSCDWNLDGRMDIICGDESGGCALIENTGKVKDGMPVFKPPAYFLQKADMLKVEVLPSAAAVDWDGDGDQDFLCGTASGYIEFLENLSGPGVERPKWAAPRRLSADGKLINIRAGENGSIQGPFEARWGYLCISAADWDGDGLVDVMSGGITGQIVWFRNTGTKTNPKLSGPFDVEVEWDGPQPELAWGWMKPGNSRNPRQILTQWRVTPLMCDLNRDGLMDILLMDTEGYLCFWERGRKPDGSLFVKPPQRVLIDAGSGKPIRPNPNRSFKSGRRRFSAGDWDGDGRLDIFVGNINVLWWRQEKAEDGKWYFRNMGDIVPGDSLHWHEGSPCAVDLNGDGVDDMAVTNEDGIFYYLRNPRTTRARP